MKSFSLIFKCWYLVINHIHKDKPGLIMLRTLICKCKTTLLCKGFFRHVLGVFKSLIFHSYIIKECFIAPSVINKQLFHFTDSRSGYLSESFTPGELVQHFECSFGIAKVKIKSARSFHVENTILETLHDESCDGTPCYSADPVCCLLYTSDAADE